MAKKKIVGKESKVFKYLYQKWVSIIKLHLLSKISYIIQFDGIPNQIFLNNSEALNSRDICNHFAKISNLFIYRLNQIFTINCTWMIILSLKSLLTQLLFYIDKMKNKKSIGADCSSAYFLKSCSDLIAFPFSIHLTSHWEWGVCHRFGKNCT